MAIRGKEGGDRARERELTEHVEEDISKGAIIGFGSEGGERIVGDVVRCIRLGGGEVRK